MAAPTPATITLDVNNSGPTTITVPDGSIPLLYVLRDPQYFGLKGPKFGCGFGQCGACETNILGLAARSCQATIKLLLEFLPLFGLATDYPIPVTTLEGIGTPENPHPLQKAFIDQQAGQCAYCANAMIMGAHAWLTGTDQSNPAPPDLNNVTVAEVEDFLSNRSFYNPIEGTTTPTPYLCRCGAHTRFVSAIQEAAKEMA